MIIEAYRQLFLWLWSFLGFFGAIVGISVIVSLVCLPLYAIIGKMVAKENELQAELNPLVSDLKLKYTDDSGSYQAALERLYARYQYNPFLAIRKVLPLFVALPFLFLTYYMLEGTSELNGISFLCFKNVGEADGLLFGINLLPFVMTGINLLTAFATPGMTNKDRNQAVFIALFFLVLLYTANAALMIYWCMNQLFNLLRSLYIDQWTGAKLLGSRIAALRHLPSATWVWLTSTRLEAISLALFLASIYMALMIVMEVWFFNCFISKFLVVPTILAAISVQALAAMRARGKWMLLPSLIFVVPVLLAFGLIVIAALAFFAPTTVQRFIAVFNPLLSFYVILGVWTLMRVVIVLVGCQVHAVILSAFLKESHWLLLPVILALHYSFSSELVKLPMDSVLMLAVELLLPAVLMAIWVAAVFSARISISSLCRVGILFVSAAYLVPMISQETGKMLAYHNNLVVRLVFMGVIIWISLRLKERKPICVGLLLLLGLTGINAVYQRFAINEEIAAREVETGSEAELAFKAAHATRSNNVYLLVYDSYCHDEILEDYKIPSRLHEILLPRGFTRYDAYSVGSDTVVSMGNSFAIGGETQGSVRSMMVGNNPLCDFLKRDGYKTSYILGAYDMPGRGERMPGDYYFPAPQAVTRLENVLFTCILKGYLSQSANTFNSYTSEEWLTEKRRVLSDCSPTKAFVYAHSEWPGHATANEAYRKSMAEEIAAFALRVKKADKEIEEDIKLVLSKDDDALIIVASDHGSCLRLCERGDFGRLDLLDRCGIQLYIRWPKGYQPTLNLKCLTNVFLEVMICLSGDTSLARFAVEGSSLPVQTPLKAPAGAIVNGVIQTGRDKGKSLFVQ